MKTTSKSIALLCDKRGTILEHLIDDCEYAEYFPSGKLFLSCFSNENFNKALEFTVHLKNSNSTFGWEIELPNGTEKLILSFGGGIVDNDLYIIASPTKLLTRQLFEKLFSQSDVETNPINNENRSQTMSVNTGESLELFNKELGRLNNEIVNYKKEISAKNNELEELNEIKNQFLGMAAHDLRNPLGNIKSYSEFLLEDEKDLTDEHIEYVKSIKALSDFMIGMVNDLLDISSIEAGNLNIIKQEENLVEVIQKNLQFTHLLAEKKNIQIHFNPDRDKLSVPIDKRKINQVLTNLLSNAIKYSFPNKAIYIDMTSDDEHTTVSIKDEGQGIPEEELPHLFIPFYKSSVRSTDGEKSTGLGLVIVRKIIEAHDGEITVESELGIGSTFKFSIPRTVNTV